MGQTRAANSSWSISASTTRTFLTVVSLPNQGRPRATQQARWLESVVFPTPPSPYRIVGQRSGMIPATSQVRGPGSSRSAADTAWPSSTAVAVARRSGCASPPDPGSGGRSDTSWRRARISSTVSLRAGPLGGGPSEDDIGPLDGPLEEAARPPHVLLGVTVEVVRDVVVAGQHGQPAHPGGAHQEQRLPHGEHQLLPRRVAVGQEDHVAPLERLQRVTEVALAGAPGEGHGEEPEAHAAVGALLPLHEEHGVLSEPGLVEQVGVPQGEVGHAHARGLPAHVLVPVRVVEADVLRGAVVVDGAEDHHRTPILSSTSLVTVSRSHPAWQCHRVRPSRSVTERLGWKSAWAGQWVSPPPRSVLRWQTQRGSEQARACNRDVAV